ncbi:hypothetical protein VE03_02265 [Pseudogymnoascus sp. 23342-1-I1]|nr:hypothetical protein VE03_02265 [Pseudogymnoascus sp. 23342-1-I1]
MAEMLTFLRGNARDILAVGFDVKKTFLFSDLEFMGGAFYENVVKVSRCITYNVSKAVFGFTENDNIGKSHFVSIQTSTSFATTFPHIFGFDVKSTSQIPSLIPCAIDQDPYFRVSRDVAPRLGYAKPSIIHAKFFPALQGPGSKMSSSISTSAIFMSDTAKQMWVHDPFATTFPHVIGSELRDHSERKINKYAFSGGQDTVEEHRRLGGDPDVDVAYQYLSFFTDNDDELETIRKDYRNADSSGIKKITCIEFILCHSLYHSKLVNV